MKIFISQPMYGKTDDTIMKERSLCMQYIREQMPNKELHFIDSFTKPDDIVGNRIKMLGHSIMMLGDADLCVFLPGWTQSPGCLVEFDVCSRYNIPVHFIQHKLLDMNAES